MLKKDFTKSNKVYIAQNKVPIIILCLLVVVGIIIAAVFGMNGNFEFKGYNEFSVKVGSENSSKFSNYQTEISKIVNSFGGGFDNLSVFDEGDNQQLIIRYTNNLSGAEQLEINAQVAEKLSVDASFVSEHVKVQPVVRATDYVYTATAVLIVVAIASVFAFVRYNGASALSLILSCSLGTLSFLCLAAIIRLKIGMSIFALIVALNLLIIYFAIQLFETIKESSWLATGNYSEAMEDALKKSKFRMCFVSIAVAVLGLLFVAAAPLALKCVSLNIMFVAVVALAAASCLVPFVWNLFITKSKIKDVKVKTTDEGTK